MWLFSIELDRIEEVLSHELAIHYERRLVYRGASSGRPIISAGNLMTWAVSLVKPTFKRRELGGTVSTYSRERQESIIEPSRSVASRVSVSFSHFSPLWATQKDENQGYWDSTKLSPVEMPFFGRVVPKPKLLDETIGVSEVFINTLLWFIPDMHLTM